MPRVIDGRQMQSQKVGSSPPTLPWCHMNAVAETAVTQDDQDARQRSSGVDGSIVRDKATHQGAKILNAAILLLLSTKRAFVIHVARDTSHPCGTRTSALRHHHTPPPTDSHNSEARTLALRRSVQASVLPKQPAQRLMRHGTAGWMRAPEPCDRRARSIFRTHSRKNANLPCCHSIHCNAMKSTQQPRKQRNYRSNNASACLQRTLINAR